MVGLRRVWGNGGLARRTVAMGLVLSVIIAAGFCLLMRAVSGLRGTATDATHSEQELTAANTLEVQIDSIETSAEGFVITGQQRFLRPWFGGRAAFPAQAATLERLAAASGPEQQARARQIRQAVQSYISGYSIPLVATARRDLAAARAVAGTGEGILLLDAIRRQFARFMAFERQIFAARQRHAVAAANQTTVAAAAAAAGTIVLILLSGSYLSRFVIRLVRRSSLMTRRLALGDLDARMPGTGPAEVSTLAESLNTMAGSLAASRDALRRVAEEHAALRRVATLVARGDPPSQVFGAVAGETGRILGAECTAVARYESEGNVIVAGSWSRPGEAVPAPPPLDSRWAAEDENGGRGAGELAAWGREQGIHASVASPIMVAGRLWGVIIAFSAATEPHAATIKNRMLDFTELLAMAIANSDSRTQLAASRARVVAAADKVRRRIERDLHDGTQQRLISLGLQLRTTLDRVPAEQRELAHQLSGIAQGLADAVTELRETIWGLHPVILEKGGLGPALRALARRSGLAVELNTRVDRRLPEQVEAAAYYVVSEALTNTAKHTRADQVRIALGVADDTLHLAVSDNGPGGADPDRGSGLIGLIDRVEAIGGRIQITSPAGAGTTLQVTIPLAALRRRLPVPNGHLFLYS
jgi:signal transduction histidine kinase